MSAPAEFTIVATHPTVHNEAARVAGIRRLLESYGYTVQRIDAREDLRGYFITPAAVPARDCAETVACGEMPEMGS